jgi:hypothetical protein
VSVSNQAVSFNIMGSDAAHEQKNLVCQNTKMQMNRDLSRATKTVICLIDDQDHIRAKGGERGFFSPVELPEVRFLIPQYFLDPVVDFNYQSMTMERLYDSLIYIHGSTSWSEDRFLEIGLTLTLAHELQHFIQYATNHSIWATNKLFQKLRITHEEEFRHPFDFPIEREARIVSKRVAIEMHGREAVENFIRQERGKPRTKEDIHNCDFLLSAEADIPYDASEATCALVDRFRPELKAFTSAEFEWPC